MGGVGLASSVSRHVKVPRAIWGIDHVVGYLYDFILHSPRSIGTSPNQSFCFFSFETQVMDDLN